MNTIEMLNIISKDSTFFAYQRGCRRKKYFFYEIIDANGAVRRLPFQQWDKDTPGGMFLSESSMTATDWVLEKKKMNEEAKEAKI